MSEWWLRLGRREEVVIGKGQVGFWGLTTLFLDLSGSFHSFAL